MAASKLMHSVFELRSALDRWFMKKIIDLAPLLRIELNLVALEESGYVVVNHRTGEVVQVSGKNVPDWVPDSRIKWK